MTPQPPPSARRRAGTLLAVCFAALAASRCAEPRPAGPSRPTGDAIAFVGVTVLPLDTAQTLPDQTVVVRGDRIERVGPRTAVAVPTGARVIDGRGRYLMPGLMDMHVHLARADDLTILLGFGITTVRNMWGAPIHLAWRDRIARGEMRGPTIYTAGPILDGEHPAHPGSLIVRSDADADRAIALHRRLGYDFVKVYSRLSPAVFDRLIAGATQHGLAVVGHVPWTVPLEHAIDAGMRSIEHLTGFVSALQSADSPVAGRSDGPSRDRQIDHVDESLLPPLARRLAARGTFDVPTRSVMDGWGSADEIRALLARPEMRWLPPCERALVQPRPDDPEAVEQRRRTVALYDRVLRALDEAGAPIATGTDLQNPLVIPGAALHRELELLVAAGLSPLAALQAATHRAAELLGRPRELGGVVAGMRADLLLLDANPLDDIRHTRRIAGVMARGRYLGRSELDAILDRIAAEFAAPPAWFRGAPPLPVDGEAMFHADYDVTWRDAPFGGERIAVGHRPDGITVALEAFDAHLGATTRALWRSGASDTGASLVLDVDGATGRAHIDARRDAAELHARGTSLPGVDATLDHPVSPDALLAPDAMLSAVVLWRPRLQPLAVGQSIDIVETDLAVASELDASERTLHVRRADDRSSASRTASISARVYQVTARRGPPLELVVDPDGWPLELTTRAGGAPLVLRRRPPDAAAAAVAH